jgi:hypothetical protein
VDDAADQLYGLPLAEFVGQRAALAKRLRAEGRRDEAAVVAKLPKPTVAAWAANQVLRTQGRDARELFAAGDALTGATRDTLRQAIARHRSALGALSAAAEGLLDPDGRSLSAATLEKVRQTLNAASLDPEIREDAQAGRLVKEQTYSGLGPGLGPAPEQPARAPAKNQAKPAPKKPTAAEKHAAARAKAEAKAAKAARRKAEQRLAAATEALRRAEATVADLREEEARAREALDALRPTRP